MKLFSGILPFSQPKTTFMEWLLYLSCSLTSTRVAGVSLGKCLTEWDRSSIVLAIARVVGTLNLTTGHAGAGVAILLSSISNIQGHSLILTFTGNRIVLAGNLKKRNAASV